MRQHQTPSSPARHQASRAARRSHRLTPLARAAAAAVSAVLLATPLWLQAQTLPSVLPTGLQIVHGQASVATQGAQMTVRNSPNAILNWQSFNIGAGNQVTFQQASAASKVLNRVTGNDPSAIFGSLTSNGQVWLLNPNGVLFGPNARVDVAGLVTSTLRLNDNDFLAGRYRFSAVDGVNAGVRNEGALTSSFGGQIVLLGSKVENTGSIEATGGNVTLAAARSVELVDTGLPNLTVKVDVPAGEVLNLGRLAAAGGTIDVYGGIVNQSGFIQADTLGTDAQGRIVLKAADTLLLGEASRTTATGDEGRGGDITLLGPRVGAVGQAVVDASGASGGGRIRLGGGFQGQDADLPNARQVVVGTGVTLKTDAQRVGDGGTVIVWSDDATRFLGQVSAQGGAGGGDGGFVEVSGKRFLDFAGAVDLRAPSGRAGTLLLDPNNITVQETTPNIDGLGLGNNLASLNLLFSNFVGVNSVITLAAVNTQLASGNVVLQADNDITVVNSTTQLNGTGSLTLQAGRNLVIGGSITTVNGIVLSANDPGGTATGVGIVNLSNNLNAGTGLLSISNNGGTGTHALGGNLTAGTLAISGNVSITAPRTWTMSGAGTAAGNIVGVGGINKAGAGVLTLAGASTYSGNTSIGAGTLRLSGAAATAGTGSIAVGANTLDITGGASVANVVTVANGGTISSSSGNGTLGSGAAVALPAGANVNLSGGGGSTLTVARALTDISGAQVTVSSGTVTLTGASTYTGGTTVSAGSSLRVSGTGTPGTGPITLNNGTLDLSDGANLTNNVAASGASSVVTNSSGVGDLNSGSAVSLAAGITLSSTGGGLTVAGPITGSGNVVKAGTAGVALTGSNTYTGTTTVTGGLLLVQGGAAIPDSSAVTVSAGALTLQNNETVASLSGAGSVLLGSSTLTVGDASSTTFSGVLSSSGTGNLAKVGSGTLTLSGANTYTGSTTVAAGTLALGATDRLPDTTTVAVASGATLSLAGADTVASLTLAGTLAGGANTLTAATYTLANGAVVDARLGTGSLTVSGNASLNQPTALDAVNVSAGTLTVNVGNALTSGTALVVAGGSYNAFSNSTNVASLQLNGGQIEGEFISSSDYDLRSGTVTGVLGGTVGVQKSTAGTVVLTGTNTYTGATTVSAGRLQMGNGGTTGTLGSGAVLNDATLAYFRSDTAAVPNDIGGTGNFEHTGAGQLSLLGNNSYLGTTLISAGTLDLGGGGPTGNLGAGAVTNNGTLRFSRSNALTVGNFISGVGSVAQTGGGTTTIAGNNNSFSGGVVINNGTLQVAGTTSALGSGTITLFSGGSLDVLGGVLVGNDITSTGGWLRSTAGTGTLGGNIVLNASTDFGDSGGVLQVAGAVFGTGSINVLGGVELNAANTFTGGTLVQGGNTLVVGSDGALGSGTLTLNNATLSANVLVFVGNNMVLGAGGGTFNPLAADMTLSGAISGPGSLTKAGPNLLTLTGNNSWAGSTSIVGGGLQINGGNAIPDTSAMSMAAGTTLEAFAAESIGSLSGSGTVIANVSLAVGLDNSNTTFSGSIDGDGGVLQKLGTGTFTLDGVSTYSGGTVIDAGTLRVSGASAALGAPTAAITLNAGTLDLVNGASLGNDLSVNGGVLTSSAGSGALLGNVFLNVAGTFNSGGGSGLTVSGPINGSAPLNIDGGVVTLLGSNGYFGGTNVTGGATVVVNNLDALGFGTLTLDGATLATAAAVNVPNAVVLGTGGGTVDTSGFASSLDGGVSGPGNLTKTGAGTLTLVGANIYAGSTDVLGGTLGTQSGAIPDTSAVTLAIGTTLAVVTSDGIGSLAGSGDVILGGASTLDTGFDNTTTTFTGVISGAGGVLRKFGGGNMTITGASTYSGGTVVTASGRFTLDGAAAVAGSGAIDVSNAVLDVANGASVANNVTLFTADLANSAGAGTVTGPVALLNSASFLSSTGGGLTVSGVISGAQGLAIGSGSVTLAGNNTYSGPTDVLAGILRVDGASAAAGTGNIILRSGATLDISNNAVVSNNVDAETGVTFGNSVGGGTLAAGALTLVDGAALTLVANGAGLTVQRVIPNVAGGAAETVNVAFGSSVVSLESASTYTGGTAVAAGASFALGGGASTAAGTGPIALNTGAVLSVGDGVTIANPLSLSSATVNAYNGPNGDGAVSGNVAVTGASFLRTSTGSLPMSGVISGSGGLQIDAFGGPVVLSAANTYAGATTVAVGTLVTAAANLLPNATALTVAAGTTLTLGGNDTVASLALAGTLGGAGTLTAASYALLSGAVVNANLGAGALVSNGTVALNATSAAGTVDINSGTLTLGSAERLSDAAALTIASGATLALNGDETVNTATVNGTVSGTGTLLTSGIVLNNSTVNVPLTVATLVSDGTSAVLADLVITVSSNVNTGTLTVGDGAISGAIGGAGTITVAPGATLAYNRSDTVTLGNIGGTGTLRQAGSGNLTLAGTVAAGAVQVNAGTVTLGASDRLADSSTLTVAGGSFNLGGFGDTVAGVTLTSGSIANGTLTSGSAFNLQGGTVAGTLTGSVGGNVSGTVTVTGALGYTGATALTGTLNFNNAAPTSVAALTMTGGTLGGTGDVTISGTFNLGGPSESFAGAGTLTTQGTTTVNLSTAGGVVSANKNWLNQGTLDIAGDDRVQINGGFTLTNPIGAVINLISTAATPILLPTSTAVLANAGTINKTAATSQNFSSGTFNNSGTVNVNAGTLDIGIAGSETGSYAVSTGAALQVGSGTRTLLDGSSFAGLGDFVIGSGTLNVATTGPFTLPKLTMTGGTLGGTANLTIAGPFDITSSSVILSGTGTLTTTNVTTVDLALANPGTVSVARPWTNTGTLTVGGNDRIAMDGASGGSLTNAAAGVLNLSTTDATPIGGISGTTVLTNAGTLNKTSAGAQSLSVNTFNNSGTVNLNAGTLTIPASTTQSGLIDIASGATLTASGNLTNASGGVVQGLGTLNMGANTLTNLGTIRPGGTGFASTLSVTGNVDLSTGTLEVELGGTGAGQSDRLAVTGNLSLGGTVNTTLINSYSPVNADFIPVVTATGTSGGSFGSLNLPSGFTAGYNLAAGEAARLIFATSGTRVFSNAAGDLNWATPTNWGGSLPGSGDEALISSGFAVTHATGTDSIAALTINSANALNVSGGSLAVSGATALGGSLTVSGTGAVTLAGPLTGAGSVTTLGGTLTLNGASTLNSLLLTGGLLNGSGSLTVTNSFGRSGGASVGSGFGSVSITQASGGLQPGAWTAGSLAFTAQGVTAGDALQVNGALVASSGNVALTAAQDVTILSGVGSVTAAGDAVFSGANQVNIGGAVAAQRVQATSSNLVQVTAGGSLTSAATSGDGIVLTGNGFRNFVGAGALSVAGGSRWLVYSAVPANDTVGGLAATFRQYNAPAATTPLGSGSGLLYSIAPALTPSLQGTASKVYDRTTTATLAPANYTVAGALAGDTVTLNNPAAGSYDTAAAGTAKTVTATGVTAAATDTLGGYPVFGYTVIGTATGAVGAITAAALTVTGTVAANKVYDAGTTATLSSFGTVTPLAGDSVTVGGTPVASFSDKSVGTAKPVAVTGLALVGADAGNYTVVQPTGVSADITALALTPSGLSGSTRVYDTTLAAPLAGTGVVTPLAGDVVALAGIGSGTFADKNVGTGKPITVSGLTLTGADAANYSLQAPAGLTGTVTPAALTVTGLTAAAKVYDGTTAATVSGTSSVTPLSGDVVALTGTATGSFADKNAGIAKAVTLSALSLTGADAGNYTPVQPGGLAADITPLALAVTGVSANNKVYDATTLATLGGTAAISPLAGDSLLLAGSAAATFSDKNVGAGKAVSVSGFSLTGADAGNYSLVQPTGLAATVTALALPVSGLTANNKVYDTTTTATLAGTAAVAPLAGDTVAVAGTAAGSFASKTVGTAKPVTVSGLSLAGTDAGNYTLVSPPGLVADITPAPLALAGVSAANKVYDANTTASATAGLAGVLAGDTVTVGLTASFSDANAGNAKTVSYTAATAGADALNYALAAASGTSTANITPATLTYTASPASGPAGSALPLLTGSVLGFVGGETLVGATTGTLAWTTPATTSNPEGSYAINGSGLAALNYLFVQAPGNATALTLSVGVTAAPATSANNTAINLGLQTVQVATAMSSPVENRVLDVVPSMAPAAEPAATALNGTGSAAAAAAAGPSFRPMNLSLMPREELQSMLAAREKYKKQTFAASLFKLEQDPTLADVRGCQSEAELGSGNCVITEALKQQIQEIAARAVVKPRKPDRRKVKQAVLPNIERKLALLIGINSYADKRVPQLEGSVRDARAVRTLLEGRLGYETTVVEDPSREALIRAFNKLALEADANDSVVIYYAGHGEVVPVNGVDTGFWMPSDVNPEDPATWLSNADIGRMVGAIGARQMMLISDSCFSGKLAGSEKVQLQQSTDAADLLTRKAAVVMSSGGNEPVADEGRDGHSPFAWHFMRAIEGLDNWQVGGSVFQRVRDAVVKEKFPQTPQYGASRTAGHQGNTDYLFERREFEAVGAPVPVSLPGR